MWEFCLSADNGLVYPLTHDMMIPAIFGRTGNGNLGHIFLGG